MKDRILITGGSGKLGNQFIKCFLSKGWEVVFTGTTESSLSRTLKQFDHNPLLYGVEVDFFQEGSIEKLSEDVIKKYGPVNHLVNNARSVGSLAINMNGSTTQKNFKDEFFLDVIVPYELSMVFASKQALELRTITNIGSQYGMVAFNKSLYEDFPMGAPIQYSVSKAALSQLTKELAIRLADRDIRVNCIAFGGIEGRVSGEFKERYSRLSPIGRMLRDDEVVSPLELLIDPRSTAITGHTLVADGGWSIW